MAEVRDCVGAVVSDPVAMVHIDGGDVGLLSDGELEERLVGLASEIFAAEARFLVLLAEFDRRERWGIGILSAAHWLSWRCGIDPATAREKVRVARALSGLPRIREAFTSGSVSYSKVRAMTRVATPAIEGELLELAAAGTAAHVERIVRGYRLVAGQPGDDENAEGGEPGSDTTTEATDDTAGEAPGDGGSGVGADVFDEMVAPQTWRRWREDGLVERVIVLTADQDAALSAALQAALDLPLDDPDDPNPAGDAGGGDVSAETPAHEAEQVSAETPARAAKHVSAETPTRARSRAVEWARPRPVREAEALLRVAETFLADPRWRTRLAGERYQVIVHVDVDELRRGLEPDPAARCSDELGEPLPIEVARRLACDCSARTLIEGAEGQPLDVGRATRSIPRAIRRALRARDGGCRFPGCTNTRWVDGHHIWHWIDGGPTRLSNLILLCRRHHEIVHEHDLGIRLLDAGRDVVFTLPDGTRIHPAPPLPTAAGLDHLLVGAELHPDQLGGWDGGPCDYSTAVATLQRRARGTAVA